MLTTMWVSLLIGLGSLLVAWGLARWVRRYGRRWPAGCVVAIGLLTSFPPLALGGYLAACWAFPIRNTETRQIARGIVYERVLLDQPHPAVMHVLRIELNTPGLSFVGSPWAVTGDTPHYAADTTEAFARQVHADAAINMSFFRPFRESHPFSYYPHTGDLVEPIGPTRSHGVEGGVHMKSRPRVTIDHGGHERPSVSISVEPADGSLVYAGRSWLVRDGEIAVTNGGDPYPRTVIGLDAGGNRLYWIVVDGKQPRYSEGMTLHALATWLKAQGVSDAIEMDGGGSATMVGLGPDGGLCVLNRPCHTKIPRRLRPVANSLGIRIETPSRR